MNNKSPFHLLLIFLIICCSAAVSSFAQTSLSLDEKIWNQFLHEHPVKSWRYDWGESVLLYGAVRNPRLRKDLKENFSFYLESLLKKVPKVIGAPDPAAPSLPAAFWALQNQRTREVDAVIEKTNHYFATEPLNAIGTLDHVGRRYKLLDFLPAAWFVKSSIWIDSAIMYILNGLYIARLENNKEKLLFFAEQLLIFHKYLYNPIEKLYAHVYYVRAQKQSPGDGFWARGNAWFAVAIVDTIELLSSLKGSLYDPRFIAIKNELTFYLQNLLTRFSELPESQRGLKTLLTDTKYKNNYYEMSASALFAYSALKAERLGYWKSPLNFSAQQLRAQVISQFKVKSEHRVSIPGISGPTTSFPYAFFYTFISRKSDIHYGVGSVLLMLSED